MDTVDLMAKVQSGDETALGSLMAEWEIPVKALLMRFLHNQQDAADLAQETFVRVWEQRAKYRPQAEFRPWLFAIAVNLARNRLRWWKRRPEVVLEAWSGQGEGEDAAQSTEAKERAHAVREAISKLPLALRESLVLAEYQGMSHAEIATTLGTSPKAVESRIYRARTALKISLRAWLD